MRAVLQELPLGFLVTVAVALGLAFGSFLNVVIHRLPRGENLAHPPSRCPACGAPIRAHQNLPVLGWVLLRGRAACCGARISPRYPLVEAIGGLAGWAAFEATLRVAPATDGAFVGCFAAVLALCLGLVALVFIDLEFMILPDELTLGGALLGVATAPLRHYSWTESLVGAAAGFLVVYLPFDLLYRKLRGHPGMGLGDAKLLLLAGAWFGWPGALFALLAGAVQGTAVTLAVLAVRGRIDEPEAVREERAQARAELEQLDGEARAALEAELAADPLAEEPGRGLAAARVPFGPFLAIATLEYLFFGEELVGGYLTLLGAGS